MGTVIRANFTVTQGVLELFAPRHVDVLIPSVRDAVLPLGVATRLEPARWPGRAGEHEHDQDDQ